MEMMGPSQSCFSPQTTRWWQEAEQAIRSGQLARARRFLRWIVACCPDEEEGWLVLARSTPGSQEQILVLRSAYRFHPESHRIQAALREVRQRQLASAVGELKPKRAFIRCLPDERQLPHQANAASGNGRGPTAEPERDLDTLEAMAAQGIWPFPSLTKLLQWGSTAPRNDGGNGQGPDLPPRRSASRY